MPMTPAKRHHRRVLAAQEAAQTGGAPRADANQYELMLAQLYEDTRRLKEIESIQRKAEVKAELLPVYEPYVDGVLSAGTGQQDDVIMTIMVWRMDAADWAAALRIAEYALEHGLKLPDRYQRSTACLIAEEVAEAAIKAAATDDPMDIEILATTVQLTAERDMPDEVRAKLHKAIGYRLEQDNPAQALIELKTALSYHDRVGVKKDIERLERALKKQVDEQNAG